MTPRPWHVEPMWERSDSGLYKIVSFNHAVVLVGVRRHDADVIVEAVNGFEKSTLSNRVEE